jgi:hypothetical protein
MYGKHFESLYEGSMVGAGAIIFAVWGYVIAKQRPCAEYGSQVKLNPKVVGPILGETPEDIEKAIEYLRSPDPNSQSKEKEGRRLIRIGQFDYQVVNGAKYASIRNYEQRREQNREAQRRFRAKKHPRKPLPGEDQAEQMRREGATQEEIDRFQESTLPKGKIPG